MNVIGNGTKHILSNAWKILKGTGTMITEDSDELAELILMGLMNFKKDGLRTPAKFSILGVNDFEAQLMCAKHLADYLIETGTLENAV